MKKEKTIRSYKRRTKSGKIVTVKQHTAKYDAAEEMKKALRKRGAGSELASKQLTKDELKQVKSIVEENSELDPEYVAAFYPELSPRMVKAVMTEYNKKSATPQAKAKNTVGKEPKPKTFKTPDLGFTPEEYKAWYHWDQESDPKNKSAMKVKKALLGAMGPRAYRKYEDEMTDSYTSRGHNKALKALPELVQARKDAYNARNMEKTHKAQKAIAENWGAKDAADHFDKRAKEQSAKRKEATTKIKELSPKSGSGMVTSDGIKLRKKKAGKGVFLVGTDGRAYREVTKKDGTISYKYSAEDTKYGKTDGGRKHASAIKYHYSRPKIKRKPIRKK